MMFDAPDNMASELTAARLLHRMGRWDDALLRNVAGLTARELRLTWLLRSL